MASNRASVSYMDAAGQAAWLKEASINVKRNAYGLRKAMDEDNVTDVLRYAAAMLGELRTSSLGPQKYYELYMLASDQLLFLTEYFSEWQSKGRSFVELYEQVQHAGNLLPRLYLLCLVGACSIRKGNAPAKLILRDVAEMCRGVQNATRGLFLRAYLVQAYRGLLPSTGSPYEGAEGGTVDDAAEFLLMNFTEMNKLWVRLQHQGGAADQNKREAERRELADLVGKNLTYLSQLEGLTFTAYQTTVLPRVLEQIIGCRDVLAQQYLLQALILAFPDDFHLGTLPVLLEALPGVQPEVRVAAVLSALLDRLAAYAAAAPAAAADMSAADALGTLGGVALKVLDRHPDMPAADVAAIYAALLGFAGTVYPDRLDYVSGMFETAYTALKQRGTIPSGKAEREVMSLLSIPLEKYDIITVLGLNKYADILRLLKPEMQREVALRIAQMLIKRGGSLNTAQHVQLLLGLLQPLIVGLDGAQLDDDEVGDDALLIAQLVHLLKSPDADEQHRILETVLAQLLKAEPARQKVMLPSVAFATLETFTSLVDTPVSAGVPEFSLEVWAKLLHRSIRAAAGVPLPDVALQLFLSAAVVASRVPGLDLVAYDMFEQAFLLYEESIPDSRDEVRALASIVGVLCGCRLADAEARAALVHKAAGYCGKLLRRQDQCLAVLAVSHLYWQEDDQAAHGLAAQAPENGGGTGLGPVADRDNASQDLAVDSNKQPDPVLGEESTKAVAASSPQQPSRGPSPLRDPGAVLGCLKRALRIAAAAQQQLIQTGRGEREVPGFLYVDILSAYLYYYDRGVPGIEAPALQQLLDLVGSEVCEEGCRDCAPLQRYYSNTLEHLAALKARTPSRYDALRACPPPR